MRKLRSGSRLQTWNNSTTPNFRLNSFETFQSSYPMNLFARRCIIREAITFMDDVNSISDEQTFSLWSKRVVLRLSEALKFC